MSCLGRIRRWYFGQRSARPRDHQQSQKAVVSQFHPLFLFMQRSWDGSRLSTNPIAPEKDARGQKAKPIRLGMVASAILIREPAEGYQCGQIRLPSTNAATVWSLFLRHKIRNLPRCREPPQGQGFAFGQFSRRNQQQRVSQSSTRIDLVRCLGFRYILRKAGNDAHVGLCAMIITRRACSSLMRNSPSEP